MQKFCEWTWTKINSFWTFFSLLKAPLKEVIEFFKIASSSSAKSNLKLACLRKLQCQQKLTVVTHRSSSKIKFRSFRIYYSALKLLTVKFILNISLNSYRIYSCENNFDGICWGINFLLCFCQCSRLKSSLKTSLDFFSLSKHILWTYDGLSINCYHYCLWKRIEMAFFVQV